MPLYTVTVAHSVQCYATTQIEAESPADLMARLSADDLGENRYWGDCRPEWSTTDDSRVVEIVTPDGDYLAENTYMDEWRADLKRLAEWSRMEATRGVLDLKGADEPAADAAKRLAAMGLADLDGGRFHVTPAGHAVLGAQRAAA